MTALDDLTVTLNATPAAHGHNYRANHWRILKILDLDEMYRNADHPISLNKIDFARRGYADTLNENLFSRVSDLNFSARCFCGHYDSIIYEGMICPRCNTKATSGMEAITGHLNHNAWISAPKSVPGFLHPAIYQILARWLRFGQQKRNYLDVIIDPDADFPVELEGVVTGRGYQYLYEHFDRLMDFFLRVHKKTATRKGVDYIRLFLQQNRHLVFCRNLPVLSSALHPIIAADRSENARRFVDKSSQYVQEAANSLSYLEYAPRPITKQATIDAIAHSAYKSYITYQETISRTKMSKKKSIPRQHIFGARFHYSFRSVIVPITGVQRYDELHLPWPIAVNTLKHHIIGRLMQRHGMSIGDAAAVQHFAITVYDPTVHKIIRDLINECPPSRSGTRGIPVLFNRNPSLKRGSIQKLYVTRVKTDPDDGTIAMSVLVLKDPNADFDGDALNGLLLVENNASREFERLHPAGRMLSTNAPEVGTTITLPNQTLVMGNAFLDLV